MRNKILFFLLSVTIIGVTGCAAIFHGTTDEVNFNSKPENCEIWINGEYRGNTPLLKVKLKSNREHTIEIKKSGFVTSKTTITNGVSAGYIVLDVLFTGLIGVVIDATTGSWYSLDETDINTNLQATTEAAPVPNN